jgi:hypothetical protein
MLPLGACSTLDSLISQSNEPQPVLAVPLLDPESLPPPPEVSDGLRVGEDPHEAWARARASEAAHRQWGEDLVELIQRAWLRAQAINKGEADD